MNLTIVMYHYVRDLARSRYPSIKGRDVASFQFQLDHIARNYSVVTVAQILEALRGGRQLPDNAAWLTFDDGYLDHYTVAFPLLNERGWQGSFFAPKRAVVDRELLDVNRIHFILAAQQDPKPLIDSIRSFVDARNGHDGVRSFEDYWQEIDRTSRYDSASVIFIKAMLQYALPEATRRGLVKTLFERFVGVDSAIMATELYMTPEQLRTMNRCGMYLGSHGDQHRWLDLLDAADQATEIDGSLAFLAALDAPVCDWVMCYPYGASNASLLDLLKSRGCAIGVTTEPRVADLSRDHPLLLPRLDTNDLPVTSGFVRA